MKVAITGAAGFIAFHVARGLLDGRARRCQAWTPSSATTQVWRGNDWLCCSTSPEFEFVELDLIEAAGLQDWLTRTAPDVVLHLAAEAGARTSFTDPDAYLRANIVGTLNLLEACRRVAPAHLLIASSSSVYGANEQPPSAETDRTDFPVSLYAATKSSVESMSHAYSHAFGIPTTCLRLFTVYGPWGRPDMALFTFVRPVLAGEPIEVYGGGELMRDFTYVADVVEAVLELIPLAPAPGRCTPRSTRSARSMHAPAQPAPPPTAVCSHSDSATSCATTTPRRRQHKSVSLLLQPAANRILRSSFPGWRRSHW